METPESNLNLYDLIHSVVTPVFVICLAIPLLLYFEDSRNLLVQAKDVAKDVEFISLAFLAIAVFVLGRVYLAILDNITMPLFDRLHEMPSSKRNSTIRAQFLRLANKCFGTPVDGQCGAIPQSTFRYAFQLLECRSAATPVTRLHVYFGLLQNMCATFLIAAVVYIGTWCVAMEAKGWAFPCAAGAFVIAAGSCFRQAIKHRDAFEENVLSSFCDVQRDAQSA